MKIKTLLIASMVTGLFAQAAAAASVASYDAGVSPTAGTTGAANPTTQGWTANNSVVNSYATGLDSTNGGWRITDGTTTTFYFYQDSLSGSEAAQMAAYGWSASWTVAVNRDAVRSDGVPNGVNDYYNAGANQNNNAMWIEVAGNGLYVMQLGADANNDITISDLTNTYQVTTDGDRLSEELGSGAPSVDYVTFSLDYDAITGDAILTDSEGNNHGVVATAGVGAQNRVIWGSYSSGGQGSTTWNSVSVNAIPEPAALGSGLIGLGLLASRRRRSK